MPQQPQQFICIVCPQSCVISVEKDKDAQFKVTGNKCPRGVEFGEQEYTNPIRMLTTTMKVKGGFFPLMPVRSSGGLPFKKIKKAMKEINQAEVVIPIKVGQVLIKDVAGVKGVDIVASRDVKDL